MKKKYIIFISIILVVIIIIISIFLVFNNKEKDINNKEDKIDNKTEKTKKECTPFVGGSFNLIFDTMGGEEIQSMNICIACSPDSYQDIPIPKKDGYKFLGWYKDKDYIFRIDFTNTKDFKSSPKYDKNKCMIGYEDITIYAKWEENVDKEDGSIPKPLQEKETVANNNNNSTVEVPSTTIYRPSSNFYVRRGFGQLDEARGYFSYDVLLGLISGGDRNLYPINSGTLLGIKQRTNNDFDYTYVLYKTNISGNYYYVLYYSHFYLRPIRDFSANRNISYEEPLVYVDYEPRNYQLIPGVFHVKLFPVNYDYDYDYEINNYGVIANNMIKTNKFVLNLDQLFNIKPGESYYSRQ